VITADQAYDLQVQSQPSSQFSQQSHSQSQSGQPSQQPAVPPLLQQLEAVVAGKPARLAAAKEEAIAREPKNFVNI
jgi:hypothetical protein